MEEKYGHYFDLVIVNNDIERTYHELVQRINYIEREPQWVSLLSSEVTMYQTLLLCRLEC